MKRLAVELGVCEREHTVDDLPVQRLMLLGHNPGWSSLYEYFCGEHGFAMSAFPTGACAVFARVAKHDGRWFMPDAWKPLDFLLPRQLEKDAVT